MSRLSQYCYLTFSCAVLTRFFCLRRSIVLTPCFASRISGSHGRLLLDIAHVASVRWNSRVDTSLEYARSTRLSFLKEPTLPPNMRSYRLLTVLNSSLDRPGIDEHAWRMMNEVLQQSNCFSRIYSYWNSIHFEGICENHHQKTNQFYKNLHLIGDSSVLWQTNISLS